MEKDKIVSSVEDVFCFFDEKLNQFCKERDKTFFKEPEENKTFFSEWKKLQVLGPKVTIDEVYKDLNRCRYGMLCPVKGYCSIECPDRTGGANVEMNAAMFEKCKDSFYKIMRGTNAH